MKQELLQAIKKSRITLDGKVLSEEEKIKGFYLLNLIALVVLIQWVLVVTGIYFCWVQNLHLAVKTFGIAFICWCIREKLKKIFWN